MARGPFAGAPGKGTTVAFPPAQGRFVSLKAFARPGVGKVCIGELNRVEAAPAARYLAGRRAAPADAKARWEGRPADRAAEALGRDFLDLLFVTPEEIHRVSNLQNREKLLEIGMSGTHATPVSFAPFKKVIPYEPSAVTPASPGLNCDDFEGFWKELWVAIDTLQPRKTGAAAGRFDLSLIPEENRRVGDGAAPREKTYAFRSTGFLKVPADGVYTLHAPREIVQPDGIAGYELQVDLGYAMIRDAGVVRREEKVGPRPLSGSPLLKPDVSPRLQEDRGAGSLAGRRSGRSARDVDPRVAG